MKRTGNQDASYLEGPSNPKLGAAAYSALPYLKGPKYPTIGYVGHPHIGNRHLGLGWIPHSRTWTLRVGIPNRLGARSGTSERILNPPTPKIASTQTYHEYCSYLHLIWV